MEVKKVVLDFALSAEEKRAGGVGEDGSFQVSFQTTLVLPLWVRHAPPPPRPPAPTHIMGKYDEG